LVGATSGIRSERAVRMIFSSKDAMVPPMWSAVARQYASGRLIGCEHRSRAASTPTTSPGRWTATPSAAIACRAIRSRSLSAAGAFTVGIALAADALGGPEPALLASVIVVIAVLIGGPKLMALVRRRAEWNERR
jgi:hypothetical protein